MPTKKTTESKDLAPASKQEIDMSRGEPTYEGRFFNFASDIVETDEAVTVLADLPGVSPATLEVDIRDNTLTIRGGVENVAADWQAVHQEYEMGGYLRQFSIGPAIDQEKVSATMRDGVLTLVLSKADRLKPRKIEVTTIK